MGPIIKSEWTKFSSARWCLFALLLTLSLPAVILLFKNSSLTAEDSWSASELIVQSRQVLFQGQAGLIVSAAYFFGQEYSFHSLRTTLLTEPFRKKVLLAKYLLLSVVGIGASLLSGIICVLLLSTLNDLPFSTAFLLHSLLEFFPVLLSALLLTWLTGALAITFKSFILPFVLLISLLLGFSQMLLAMTEWAKFLPDIAVMNLFLDESSPFFLEVETGVICQFLWVFVFGFYSSWQWLVRDVR
ncbi:ABC transporter permease [Enterococcus sp. LJL128]